MSHEQLLLHNAHDMHSNIHCQLNWGKISKVKYRLLCLYEELVFRSDQWP